MARRVRPVLAVLALASLACGLRGSDVPSGARAASGADSVAWWLTTPDSSQRLALQPPVALLRRETPDTGDSTSGAAEVTRIDVDPAQAFQSIVGFGAALTDASASLIHGALPDSAREALLQELFGRDTLAGAAGISLSFVRLTIGASDFSRSHYSLDDLPAGAPVGARDDSLTHFSLAPAREHVLPLMQRARELNPSLTVMATPWSAPAWMKSTHSLIQGTLRPDAYPAFAAYLQRFVAGFAAEGVPIALLSVQNEPHFEPADYPGMRFPAAARATFLSHHLGPLLASRNPDTRVLDWDHNWDDPASPLAVLSDSAARRYVAGIAWHCYAGDVSAQSQVHDTYPEKDAYFTECAGGDWAPDWGENLRWNARVLIIGATRNWARGVALWNLALDERHGPHTGGCNDCRGVLTIDTRSGVVTRNPEYYALAHASRFVRAGARRIASASLAGDLKSVAFRNTDDGSRVLLVVNLTNASRTLQVHEVATGRAATTFRAELPAGAVATFRWY
ncbi:MAG: glycoside hydrolase family 30 beta sandwich domain-containing protein [Gemmatimonadota bacterium]